MAPPPTSTTSIGSLDTFITSMASSTIARMTAIARSATSCEMSATIEGSPTEAIPRRTAMSVAVIVSPPNTSARSVMA